jgi:hypothetical protein
MKVVVSTMMVAMLALFGVVGCGDDGDGGGGLSLKDQPLQGTINGEPWEFTSGDADEGFGDDGTWSVTLRAGTVETCPLTGGPADADDREVISSFPQEPGEYPLGFNSGQTVTFAYGEGQNVIGTEGTLVISEVTDAKITGSLVAKADADHEVNGNFELARCDVPAEE